MQAAAQGGWLLSRYKPRLNLARQRTGGDQPHHAVPFNDTSSKRVLLLTRVPSCCTLQASMGIYLFKRSVLEELLHDKNPGGTGRQDEHFGYDVIPHALRNGAKVRCWPPTQRTH